MRSYTHYSVGIIAVTASFLVVDLFAQTLPVATSKEVNAVKVAPTNQGKSEPAKKQVQEATINLQTTVTGNQEQPKVLYILPWQSPQTTDVDFESLVNQEKSVFGHVEREELRRELESSGEIK